jgi:hypothetical protein
MVIEGLLLMLLISIRQPQSVIVSGCVEVGRGLHMVQATLSGLLHQSTRGTMHALTKCMLWMF